MKETHPSTLAYPTPLFQVIHLFALVGFALAQPLFELLQRDATFFIARHSKPVDVWVLVALLLFAVPLALGIIEWIAGLLASRVRSIVHGVLVAALLAIIAMPPLKRYLGVESQALFAVAGSVGILVALAYTKVAPLRTFMTLLAMGPVLFATLFLMSPSIGKVLRGQSSELLDGEVRVGNDQSVILIVFDELPTFSLLNAEEEIDGRLFPHFARLARTSTWFLNASASHQSTNYAVPAIMDGVPPDDSERLPIAADHPRSIFHILAGSHRMKVVEEVTDICPRELVEKVESREPFVERLRSMGDDLSIVYGHVVLPAPLTDELPDVTGNWGDFRGPSSAPKKKAYAPSEVLTRKEEALRDFTEMVDDSEEPTLYFLHVVLPHRPWYLMQNGTRYQSEDIWGHEHREWPENCKRLVSQQRHMFQLGYTDRALGRLLDRFEEKEVFDRSLVIVTADHGISFEARARKRSAVNQNENVLYVPLFIKMPFQREPAKSERNVEVIDILPTVLDVLDAEVDWDLFGMSAFDQGPERPTKTIYATRTPAVTFSGKRPPVWSGLQEKLEYFDSNDGWPGLHAIGSGRELLGKPVTELTLLDPLEVEIGLDGSSAYDNVVDPNAFAPCYVTGEAKFDSPPPRRLRVAVATDGVIRGVAPVVFESRSSIAFGMVLPAESFRAGKNPLQIFGVTRENELIPFSATSMVPRYRLEEGRIVHEDGSIFSLENNALEGRVESARINAMNLTLTGWAVDSEANERAERVLLFVDGQFAFETETGLEHSALAGRFGEGGAGAVDGGFKMKLPVGRFGNDVEGRLRLYCVSAGRAGGMLFSKRAAWVEDDDS